jgi:hypothetical protein
MQIFRFFFIVFMLLTIELMANGTQNSQHKEFGKWFLSPLNSDANIEMIDDKERKKKVYKLQGNGTRSSYIYRFNQKLEEAKVLGWSMLYKEDYVIMIVLNTIKGKRSLIYTPSTTQTHLQFGLGESSISNEWKEYYRDLENDLQSYEPKNQIVTLDYFVVRGSGLIETPRIEKIKKRSISKTPLQRTKVLKSQKSSQNTLTLPVIKILGDNPLILKKGQKYAEQGVVARDIDGSMLRVDISHTIDAYKDGEYSVIYMSTNSLGNTAVDRRIVRVGNVPISRSTPIIEEEEETMEEDEQHSSSPKKSAIESLLPSDKQVKEQKTPEEEFPERPGL